MRHTFISAVTLLLVFWEGVEGQNAFDCNLNLDIFGPFPNLPQATGQPPFFVAAAATSYTVGTPVQVFVATTSGLQAASVIIQAQRVDTGAPVGTFAIPDQADYGFPACPGTLVSSNTNPKNLPLIFMWTPGAAVGNVRFVASLVEVGANEAWIGVESTTELTGPDAPAACVSNPCLNNGICNNIANGFVCQCLGGFSGDRCQTAPAGVTCATNPCQNGATCFDIPNGVFCNCLPGFTGDRCQIGAGPGPLEISPCPPSINNFGGNTFTWTPPSCSRDGNTLSVSTCDRTPGVFVGAVNSVTCTCQAGDETVTCPFNINATPVGPACAQNPCAAGLDCQESESALAGYTCHITTGAACPVN